MKIFVTIGTQEPFDRLIKAVDQIAAEHKEVEFVAQTVSSKYVVRHMKTFDFIAPGEYNKILSDSSLIVSHAGIGTIISALQINKPIIVLNRIAKLGEHRNEHQLATVKKMKKLNFVHTANDENDLKNKLKLFIEDQKSLPSLHQLGKDASPELTKSIRDFIQRNF